MRILLWFTVSELDSCIAAADRNVRAGLVVGVHCGEHLVRCGLLLKILWSPVSMVCCTLALGHSWSMNGTVRSVVDELGSSVSDGSTGAGVGQGGQAALLVLKTLHARRGHHEVDELQRQVLVLRLGVDAVAGAGGGRA
jgi:hypothetical protein